MTETLALAMLLAQISPGCATANPVLTTATSTLAGDVGQVNTYRVHVTVLNTGKGGQRGNVLQSVSITEDDNKNGEKGIPPLPGGGSYAFDYLFKRSNEAAKGTTTLLFQLHPDANVGPTCNGDMSSLTIHV